MYDSMLTKEEKEEIKKEFRAEKLSFIFELVIYGIIIIILGLIYYYNYIV